MDFYIFWHRWFLAIVYGTSSSSGKTESSVQNWYYYVQTGVNFFDILCVCLFTHCIWFHSVVFVILTLTFQFFFWILVKCWCIFKIQYKFTTHCVLSIEKKSCCFFCMQIKTIWILEELTETIQEKKEKQMEYFKWSEEQKEKKNGIHAQLLLLRKLSADFRMRWERERKISNHFALPKIDLSQAYFDGWYTPNVDRWLQSINILRT